MSEESLSLAVDLLFVATGIGFVGLGLVRRQRVPLASIPGMPGPEITGGELVLTAAALVVAVIGPNILVMATTPGMPEMPVLFYYALLPSLILLAVVLTAAGRRGVDRLTNRMWVGLWAGAASTGMLDAFRLAGFHLGWMPGNMPRMFGVLILDRMALGPTLGSDALGYVYHYWVGACFGLAYTLFAGRFRWWGGLVWGLIVEIGMMVTSPMVVAMDTGYFGAKFGPGLLGTSLTAHVAFGIALGLLAERHVAHTGTLPALVRAWWRSHSLASTSANTRTLRPR